MLARRLTLALAVAAAACGARVVAPHERAPGPVAPAPAPSPGMIESIHGGKLTMVALTADGGAAVSVDELGGVRLLSALDGSVEPRVVDIAAGPALAVVRDPRGFVLAMVDGVGGLTVQLVDEAGRTQHRVVHAADPAFVGVEATPDGFLAWRADQMVLRLDVDGTIVEQLATEPGDRVRSIAVTGTHAVAIIQRSVGPLRARRLAVAPTLAWGDRWPIRMTFGPSIAVSPSGTRIATVVAAGDANGEQLRVFDAVTGKLLLDRVVGGPAAFDFVSDTQLAYGGAHGISWLDLAKPEQLGPRLGDERTANVVSPGIAAVAGGRAVAAVGGDLAIATPGHEPLYLGYGIDSARTLLAADGTRLAMTHANRMFALDDLLRATPLTAIDKPDGGQTVAARFVGEGAWLVEHVPTEGRPATLSYVTPDKTTVVRTLPDVQAIAYEASTRLATVSSGQVIEVRRFDRARGAFELVASMAGGIDVANTLLTPVAPALADGVRIVMTTMGSQTVLRWIADPSTGLAGGPSITVDGILAVVARSGHAFVWENAGTVPVVFGIYRHGERVGTLIGDDQPSIWPDPTGTRVAIGGSRRVRVVGLDGEEKWSAPFVAAAVVWTEDALVMSTPHGIVVFDAATGAVRGARCGWRFGLTREPHAIPERSEPVCAQLR